MGLTQVSNFIHKGQLNEALSEIALLSPNEINLGYVYKGCIKIQKGEFANGLEIIEKVIHESRENENWIEEFCATSVKANILLNLKKVVEAKKSIEQAELLINLLGKEIVQEKYELDYWRGILLKTKGLIFQIEMDLEQALELLQKSLYCFQEFNNYYFISDLLFKIGYICQKLGKYNLALSYYHEKLSLIDLVEINSEELFLLFDAFGKIHLEKGQYDQSLYYFEKNLELHTKSINQPKIARIKQLIGKIHINMGNFDLASQYFKKSIDIHEEVGDTRGTGWSLLQVAFAEYKKGNLDQALLSYNKCLEYFAGLDDKLMSAWTIKSIGEIHHQKGEYKIALDYYQQNIMMLTKLNNKFGLADGLNKIGEVHYHRSELNNALDHFQQSLSIYLKIGDEFSSASTIFNLIRIKLEMNAFNQSKYFLKMLKKISERTQDKHIKLKYRVAEGLIAKNHKRIYKKIEAQKIFYQIINEEIIDHEMTTLASLNLCDLLIAELWMYQEEAVLIELKKNLADLYEIAQEQKSFNLLVEVLLLQVKFALIDGNADHAFRLLNQADITVADFDLHHLETKVNIQQEHLRTKLDLWDELNRKNASIRDRIDLASLDGYMEKIFKKG